jgi:hypothetical protein
MTMTTTTTTVVTGGGRGSRPNIPPPAGPPPTIGSAPRTPRELYAWIKTNCNRLFFDAYPNDHDPNKTNESKEKKKKKKEKRSRDDESMRLKWYLVQVDLDQCLNLELKLNC